VELFSELYSCYYQVASRVLKAATAVPLSLSEMSELVDTYAFAESSLYLLPRLAGEEWGLMEQQADGWRARVKHLAELPLTGLQKSWLRAVLDDPRMRLFLTGAQQQELAQALEAVKPLYLQEDFYDFDQCGSGDPYEDTGYCERFRQLTTAMQKKQALCIRYRSPAQETIADYLPCHLEYSRKDDRFRLYAVRITGGRLGRLYTINLGRVQELRPSRECWPQREEELEERLRLRLSPEPVRFLIYKERNALERCMLHFASYQKQTSYDPQREEYTCSIWYDPAQETELLIRLLQFGPVVRVLGPEHFLKQVKERVQKQYWLIHQPKDA
jgi:predicted DNA-binding transcriptional regulator YafY